MRRAAYPPLWPLILLAVGGCQGFHRGQVAERLDPATGITYVVQRDALVFARGQPQYSRSARDYLYLGPVEINRQGRREHFLWVGLGTTIDRGYLAAGHDSGDVLYLEINGELMAFPLQPWQERAPDLGHVEAYRPAVSISESLAAPVTLDQLGVLAATAWHDVYLAGEDQVVKRYVRWDEDSSAWSAFVEQVADSGVLAKTANRPAVRATRVGQGAAHPD